jgi:hypothetical protein
MADRATDQATRKPSPSHHTCGIALDEPRASNCTSIGARRTVGIVAADPRDQACHVAEAQKSICRGCPFRSLPRTRKCRSGAPGSAHLPTFCARVRYAEARRRSADLSGYKPRTLVSRSAECQLSFVEVEVLRGVVVHVRERHLALEERIPPHGKAVQRSMFASGPWISACAVDGFDHGVEDRGDPIGMAEHRQMTGADLLEACVVQAGDHLVLHRGRETVNALSLTYSIGMDAGMSPGTGAP